MITLIYTLPDCSACQKAKTLLADSDESYREIPLDNPLVEMGARSLFKDRKLRAPIVIRAGRGAFVLSSENPPRLVRLVIPEREAAHG